MTNVWLHIAGIMHLIWIMPRESLCPYLAKDRERKLAMHAPHIAVRVVSILACLGAASALAEPPSEKFKGWELEQGVEPPSYAVVDPVSTNLNIDSVVLGCEEAGDNRVLQLQIYLSTEGPLAPKGVDPRLLKDEPRAEIAIDGRVFPVGLMFADNYAVLGDETVAMFPALSDRLVDAMQTGRTMVLRFDLLAEGAGQPAAFVGEAAISLQAGAGGAAVSALRRCTHRATSRSASVANAGF